MEGKMNFTITGEAAKIVVDLISRNDQRTEDYWDANWIYTKIEIVIPEYQACLAGDLRTDEISSFLEGLRNLSNSSSTCAELTTLEELIHLKATISKIGQIKWRGKAKGEKGVLDFEFLSDQSYLPQLISQLELVMQEFPVKGTK